jgi:hypothetical protein
MKTKKKLDPKQMLAPVLNRKVQSRRDGKTTIGDKIMVQAVVDLAIISLGRWAGKTVWSIPETLGVPIMVSADGKAVDFFVETGLGNPLHVYVLPTDFDLSQPDERERALVYRAAVNVFRQVEINTDGNPEAKEEMGPFSVFCSEEDGSAWAETWAEWERLIPAK